MPNWKRKAIWKQMRRKGRKCAAVTGTFWHLQSAVSLYLGNKQMEREREQMRGEMEEGEGPNCYLPHREAYLPAAFFKTTFLYEQLFGSQRAVVTGKYIRPDLVCFGCFGDAAIMRDRGLVIKQGRFLYFSFIQLSRAHFLQLVYSFSTCSAAPPPTLVSSFMPYSIIPCS